MESTHSVDEIIETLQNEIVSLAIKPGASLSEHLLCERFKVSRTPIRTCLQKLESKGFVQITPYKGTTVTRLDYRRIDQDIYARVAVESMVMRDFLHVCSPADREAAHYALECLEAEGRKYTDGTGDFDIYRFLHCDLGMHLVWYRGVGKESLAPGIRQLDASYARFMTLDIGEGNNVPDVLRDHREMLSIIDSGDVSRIEPLFRSHLYGNIRRLGTRLFTEFRDYFVEERLPL